MRRGAARSSRPNNTKNAYLGETSSSDNTSSYRSPSPDPNMTNYSSNTPRRTPKSNAAQDQQVPRINATARKSTGPQGNLNRTNREVSNMDLTANRNTRASMGARERNTSGDNANDDNRGQGNRTRQRKQMKPRKKKPGVRALMEIKKFQSSVHLLIPKLPFGRLIREILIQVAGTSSLRVTRECLAALQESSELYMVHYFEDAMRLAIHAKRVTLMVTDMQLIGELRRNWGLM